jgi:hypothetical protein
VVLSVNVGSGGLGQLTTIDTLLDRYGTYANNFVQRQSVISQFYQSDKLVVEGGKTDKQYGERGNILRQKNTG